MTSEKKSIWEQDSWLSEDDKNISEENNIVGNEGGIVNSFKQELRSEIESLSAESGQKLGSWITESLRGWVIGEDGEHSDLPDPVVIEKKTGFFKRSLTRIVNVGVQYVDSESKKQGGKS